MLWKEFECVGEVEIVNEIVIDEKNIQSKIYTIRGVQVMLDRDLAILYQVETKRVNEAVKNNPDKFPQDFYFQLTDDEFDDLRSKFSTTNFSKVRANPKVFTEQGVYMLATVLKSKVATEVTLSIMRTFAKMKFFLRNNSHIFDRFERIEYKLTLHDKKLNKLFEALEDKTLRPTQGIFFNGQIFDAYAFAADLIKSAKCSIILIDNYIDESVLTLFSKNQNVNVTIYTKSISKQLKLDLQKYNTQYRPITVKIFKDAHDRFLIIDENEIYHIGASLKDLGMKWFLFQR